MDTFKIVVTAVLTTLAVVSLGVVATTALWPDTAQAHAMGVMRGYGHSGQGGFASRGAHCARFGPRHTQLLEAFVSIELGLDDSQDQALQPVIEAVDRWRSDTVETCENQSISTVPEGLEILQQVLSRSEQAVAEISPLFTSFYATLDVEQRANLDGWVNRHNPH
jgi:hypothetical protein